MVSIIIPTFNREKLINDTLKSVMNQSYHNLEVIVIDDGSIDGTWEILKKFDDQDDRVRIFARNRDPKGASTCRNIGIEKAKGDFIMFLDSDDLLAEYCLERRIKYFSLYPEFDFIVFNSWLFNNDKNEKKYTWNIKTEENDLGRFLRLDGVWQTTGPIYKSSFIKQFFFNERIPFLQDYYLAVQLLLKSPSYLNLIDIEPDYFIRRHEGESISQKGFESQADNYRKFKIYMSVFDLYDQSDIKNNYYSKQFIPVYYFFLKKYIGTNSFTDSLSKLKRVSFLSFFNFRLSTFITIDLSIRKMINLYNYSFLKWFLVRIQYLIHTQIKDYNKIYLNKVKYKSNQRGM
jgi:glycosyltransferase involved in cell wall biosynthesis